MMGGRVRDVEDFAAQGKAAAPGFGNAFGLPGVAKACRAAATNLMRPLPR